MGPTAEVLLLEEIDVPVADLQTWAEAFARDIVVNGDDVEFWVRDGAALGVDRRDVDEACQFSVGCYVPGAPGFYPEEYAGLPSTPVKGIGIGAGCNERVDHALLGAMALSLARRYDGLVSFGDSLPAEVQDLPGRRWDGDSVGDAEFLAAWLRHPGFHMIK